MTYHSNDSNPVPQEEDHPDLPPSAFERNVSRWMGILFGLLGCALTYGAARMLIAGLTAPQWPSGLGIALPAMFAAAAGVGYGAIRLWRNAGRQ